MKFNDKYDAARPYIACFVVMKDADGKIAMVMRKNTGWMDGLYGLPAGKVEYGESYIDAAIREAKEEAGVEIKKEDLKFSQVIHRHAEEGDLFMDWVDVYFEAHIWTGEPFNAEPEKSESLDWVDITKQADQIVPPQLQAIQNMQRGIYYSNFGW